MALSLGRQSKFFLIDVEWKKDRVDSLNLTSKNKVGVEERVSNERKEKDNGIAF